MIDCTTWESNLKRLKELKKYKEMWEGFKIFQGKYVTEAILGEWEQRYFPKPKEINYKDKFNELEEEFIQREREFEIEIEHWKYLYRNKQY